MNILDIFGAVSDLIGVVTDLQEFLASSTDAAPDIFIFFPFASYRPSKDQEEKKDQKK